MKNWFSLLMCLLFSAGIWLVGNLSRNYSAIVNVPVIVSSNIEGRASQSLTEVSISGRVTASGFRLIALRNSKPVPVFIKSSDFIQVDKELFRVPASNLNRYTGLIFGNNVNTETLISEEITVRFLPELFKKVPVKGVLNLSYKPQYKAVGPVAFSPDSLLVYGEPSKLEHVDAVLTRPIVMNDIKRSVHGVAKVDTPPGIRISEEEVSYSINVSRYVDISTEATISLRNVPSGLVFSIFPSKVKATFSCVFPPMEDPAEKAVFYIDYDEFAESLTGRCIIHCENLPESVMDYKLEPQICECFLESNYR